jgi:hypothetical protein
MYLLGGYSNSPVSYDKTEPFTGAIANNDYWVIKLNDLGTIEWQNTIGGNSNDRLVAMDERWPEGYVLSGTSMSYISGDKTVAYYGNADYWVVQINGNGELGWQRGYGGDRTENMYAICQTADGGYGIAGESHSGTTGNKTESGKGTADYWVIKLYPERDMKSDTGQKAQTFGRANTRMAKN